MSAKYAIVAGFLIGLGVIINTLATNPVLGAFLFSFGLLTIIELKIPLFTGQIGFISERKISDLFKILIFNFIGISIAIGLKITDDPFPFIFMEKAIAKFDKTSLQLFYDGFLCGTLIHFAVKCKKQLLTMMAVMLFILSGAEHCVADYPYLLCVPSLLNIFKFMLIILGNSLGAIFIENLLKKEVK